ncbi:membrane protein [Candidatus Dependentiae bacterium Noda2021]|nr:membrane protein [Candidatus Dependentiae bacterium Noda2021]
MNNHAPEHRAHDHLPIHDRWLGLLGLGIFLLILGTIALGLSVYTTLASVLVLGGFLIAGGILQLIHSFYGKTWRGFIIDFVLGILNTVVGGLLVARPAEGALSLTLILAMLFLIAGFFKIGIAITRRMDHYGWVILSGVINIVLALLILAQWPNSGLWVIGAFIAIDLIFSGWSYIMLALYANRIKDGSKRHK